VSEYQYFEFRAIDRPLDDQAQRTLRGISSRAAITATSFTNTYQWGDLKADPSEMLARWFDALLHVTNWGTRWLAFRVPSSSAVDLAPYEGELFSSREHGEHLCLHFLLEDEDPSDWIDGEEWLGSLLPLREALGAGDLRSLYLAWLVDAQRGWLDEDETEPPVPPGLGELDTAHRSFVEFMQVDQDLLAIAAEASAPLAPTDPTAEATREWLDSIDELQKDEWLVRLLEGDGARLRWELQRRLRDALDPGAPNEQEPRTVGTLVEHAAALAGGHRRRARRKR